MSNSATSHVSLTEAFRYGWNVARNNIWVSAGYLLLIAAISLVPYVVELLLSALLGLNSESSIALLAPISLSLGVLKLVISAIIGIGAAKIPLDFYNKGQGSLKEFFRNWDLIGKFIIGTLLYDFIVVIGLLLFIIPGIIWGIKFSLYDVIIVDKKLGPIEALTESSKITAKAQWKVFWLHILSFLVNILGFCLLGVGLFITVFLTSLAYVYVYKRLLVRGRGFGYKSASRLV